MMTTHDIPKQAEQSSDSSAPTGKQDGDYDIPANFENLNEVASSARTAQIHGPEPGQQQNQELEQRLPQDNAEAKASENQEHHVSMLATEIYTISYLILFSFLGTLARLGLTALTSYPGTPILFSELWANVGGSLVMGFLAEDRMLFRHEWGSLPRADIKKIEDPSVSGDIGDTDKELAAAKKVENALAASKKAHLAAKKTIPLYIGLATGFCGSFTSFSTFIKDAFLALSNDMSVPGAADLPISRNGGYSFMALLAVIITTVALSMSALFVGAHLASATQSFLPSLPYRPTRKFIDPLGVVLAWGCWLGTILLSIFPPHDYWRGRATFALVFAPLGCLLRFYLALFLNGKRASFPIGTFAANILGTVILGMAWDIAHVQSGGVIGCQVLQGIEDGFCGCLTTISTWVAELAALRRRHAYTYGLGSVVAALALMIAIMGGLRWTHGFDALLCS